MQIKMYNMEFGESILVRHNGEGLLIDCGSEDGNTLVIQTCAIARELNKLNKKSLMISHFHDDHINGLPYLSNCQVGFDTIYLPNIFCNQSPGLQLLLLKDYLQNRYVRTGSGSTVWNLIKKLIRQNSRLVLLEAGSDFNQLGSTFHTYWPDSENLLFSKEIIKFIEEQKQNLLKILLSTEQSGDYADRLSYIFKTIFEISEEISCFVNAYVEGREYREDNLRKIDDRLASLFQIQIDINEKTVKSIVKKIHYRENMYSIVCCADLAEDKNTLFTGDITEAHLNSIIKSICEDYPNFEFYCIKAPHHGTTRHMGNIHEINCRNVIISNGNTSYCSRGKISQNYQNYIGNVMCTNGMPGRCDIVACPKSHKCCSSGITI